MPGTFEQHFGRAKEAFGDGKDPIDSIAARAEKLFPSVPIIVWEGDAQTFQFSYVSKGAERILGHAIHRWTTEPTFWADHVVHPEDRDDAVAYCALATGKCRDHAFQYRAVSADGRIVELVDYVQVVIGKRGIAERLRGIMMEATSVAPVGAKPWQSPPREALETGAPSSVA